MHKTTEITTEERMTVSENVRLWLPVLGSLVFIGMYVALPDVEPVSGHDTFLAFLIGLTIVFAVLAVLSYPLPRLRKRTAYRGPFLCGLVLVSALYDFLTLKTAIAPLPYFPSLTKISEAFTGDWQTLFGSFFSSIELLFWGFLIGIVLGLINGIVMGLFPKIAYWLDPIFKFIGPIPPAALVPITIILAPTSFAAAVFLIVYAVWYPVTVQVLAGVTAIPQNYFDVAKTLGGGRVYQLAHIVIPSVMPALFYGMYMGFCYSFATLIIAEMMGAGAGLGYYINWAMGWGSYYKLYAALILIAVLCSGLIWILFRVRKHVLKWQKESATV